MAVSDNLKLFYAELERACQSSGRSVQEISVMAVSKTRSVDEITEARQAGLHLFGENRVEEAAEKFAGLDAAEYPLVLIGHLQSNKAARIDRRFSAVHSVDSIRLARRLSAHRESINAPLEILLQVNTSGEESKSGFRDEQEFLEAAAEIASFPFLKLKGVMTMAPFVDNEHIVRSCFARCRQWAEKMRPFLAAEEASSQSARPIISMGMSSDFAWAVAEGSTMLRIGTTIFGARH